MPPVRFAQFGSENELVSESYELTLSLLSIRSRTKNMAFENSGLKCICFYEQFTMILICPQSDLRRNLH